MLEYLSDQVQCFFQTVDSKVQLFTQASGISCPAGCGFCCFSEKVEATVLEMLPMAFQLFRQGQAELVIKRIERSEGQKKCILLREDFLQQGKYGCSMYPYRALVCRLFAYCATLDKHGQKQFSICPKMKSQITAIQKRQVEIAFEQLPVFSEFGRELTYLNPPLGTTRKPINRALLESLYKVGTFLSYAHPQDREISNGSDNSPDKPHSPGQPPLPKAA